MQWMYNGVDIDTGRRYANYYWFPSRSERDQWVSEGTYYRGRGFRETVSGRDTELRRLQNLERAHGERGLWIASI
jgi:hypothetical protein